MNFMLNPIETNQETDSGIHSYQNSPSRVLLGEQLPSPKFGKSVSDQNFESSGPIEVSG